MKDNALHTNENKVELLRMLLEKSDIERAIMTALVIVQDLQKRRE